MRTRLLLFQKNNLAFWADSNISSFFSHSTAWPVTSGPFHQENLSFLTDFCTCLMKMGCFCCYSFFWRWYRRSPPHPLRKLSHIFLSWPACTKHASDLKFPSCPLFLTQRGSSFLQMSNTRKYVMVVGTYFCAPSTDENHIPTRWKENEKKVSSFLWRGRHDTSKAVQNLQYSVKSDVPQWARHRMAARTTSNRIKLNGTSSR